MTRQPLSSRSRRGEPLALLAGVVVALSACRYEPKRPVLAYSLSETTLASEMPPKVRDHISGSLEMLFGSPSNPQFMRLAQWTEDGFDPNYPQYPADEEGGGEFSEEQWEHILAGNQIRFQRILAQIAAGDYAAVHAPINAPDLVDGWTELLGQQSEFEKPEEFQAEATHMFAEYYPTLRDSAELYRLQCLHCHGVEGGGNGPTADFLDPRPRDYRLGVFKFTALKDKANPRRSDLLHVLEQGATGTAMPSFRRFSPAELNGLVDYVRLLSMRGMVERDLRVTYENEDPITPEYVAESYAAVWERWQKAPEKFVAYAGEVPAPTPEGIARGKALFEDAAKGNCMSCHGASGRGDGSAAFTVNEEGKRVSAYQDDWGRDILPRNLTQGIYRGGGRPIDIYRRIYSGINGTPMPALGESKDASGNPLLTPKQLWDMVHYARSLGMIHEQAPPEHGEHGGHGAETHAPEPAGESHPSKKGH